MLDDVWNEENTTKDVPVKSDRDRVTVTMKGGAGFDAPWIVLHADSVTEVETLLEEIDSYGLCGQVAKTSAWFQSTIGPKAGSNSFSAGPARPSWGGNSKPAPQAPHGAPTASCPQHGTGLVYNEPFSSNGKQISGRLACPERGCRAITIWHNKDGSWKQQ